jgi:hypothetical protein
VEIHGAKGWGKFAKQLEERMCDQCQSHWRKHLSYLSEKQQAMVASLPPVQVQVQPRVIFSLVQQIDSPAPSRPVLSIFDDTFFQDDLQKLQLQDDDSLNPVMETKDFDSLF